uniref:C2H2-type domain-containing protein n=1 Tax=Timema tahoe TaxID=61484 RepID=A0A7R9IRH6_9NEOP|nr:unnamed protein product [Timema tahoe]
MAQVVQRLDISSYNDYQGVLQIPEDAFGMSSSTFKNVFSSRQNNETESFDVEAYLSSLSSGKTGLFICPKCNKMYRWKHSLVYHLRYECGQTPRFKCPLCFHMSKQKSNYYNKSWKKYVKITSSDLHSASGALEKTDSCGFPAEAFVGIMAGSLKHPVEKCPSLPSGQMGHFICSNCGKIYRWKHSLVYHMRNECGQAPRFKCPLCPHRSKQRSNIKTHVKYRHAKEYESIFHV